MLVLLLSIIFDQSGFYGSYMRIEEKTAQLNSEAQTEQKYTICQFALDADIWWNSDACNVNHWDLNNKKENES